MISDLKVHDFVPAIGASMERILTLYKDCQRELKHYNSFIEMLPMTF